MSVMDIAKELVSLCRQGKNLEAMKSSTAPIL
jgi:hypothetical protein